MATRSIGILLMAALVAFLIAVAPSSSAAKPRPPLSTRQHDTDLRVVLRLVRVEVRSGKKVPESCGLSDDSDLAILHYVVRNFGNRPYAGHVNLFSLLSPPTTAGDEPAFWGEIHPEPGDCGDIAHARYPIEAGFDPPLAKKRARRFHALFAIPHQTPVARVIYHDDDFPTCLSAPRTTYRPPGIRPKRRGTAHVPCDFFLR